MKKKLPVIIAVVLIIVIIAITAGTKILERFSLEGKNIECIYSEDWATADDYHRIMRHWDMNSIPQFLLINRDGIIVDYGSGLRPSYPKTVAKIDALLK